MTFSILPLLLIIVFVFCIVLAHRAEKLQVITREETRQVNGLFGMLFIWGLICTAMGIKGFHTSPVLLERVPFLWQAVVPVVILAINLFFSKQLRVALRTIAAVTPLHWLVFFQALRIGALGGVLKGIQGEITSSYVYWVGIPDLLYGISALVLGGLLLRNAVSRKILMIWNLIGPVIILLPTFLFMNYFMNEPGFIFIFEFPMVLAPGIVVPIFISLNLLTVWKLYEYWHKAAAISAMQRNPGRLVS